MTCGIYCIECLVNHNEYIGLGLSIEGRWNSHKHKLRKNKHVNKYLQRSWNKYGEDNFVFYIIEECDKNELRNREQYYIKERNTKVPNGYNMTDGGDGGLNPIQEVIEKIIENHADMSGDKNPFFGKKHSEDTIKKMSESKTGENHPNFGKHRSDETKKNISESNMGHIVSDETRNKISLSKIGTIISDITKEKMVKSHLGKKFGKSSKYFGVFYSKSINRWVSKTQRNGKIFHIKTCRNEIDAAKAYDKYIVDHNLPNPLNFPEDYNRREVD